MIEREIDNRTSLIVDPRDGKIPPMTADGRERLARTPRLTRQGNRAAGPEDLSNAMRCITYGMPRLGVQNINAAGPMGYYQILQTPGIWCLASRPSTKCASFLWTDGRICLRTAAVERRLARPMGREHAGRRHHQFLAARADFMGSAENLHVIERFTRVAADMTRLRNHGG